MLWTWMSHQLQCLSASRSLMTTAFKWCSAVGGSGDAGGDGGDDGNCSTNFVIAVCLFVPPYNSGLLQAQSVLHYQYRVVHQPSGMHDAHSNATPA